MQRYVVALVLAASLVVAGSAAARRRDCDSAGIGLTVVEHGPGDGRLDPVRLTRRAALGVGFVALALSTSAPPVMASP